MSVASGTDVPLPTNLKFWRDYANVKDNFFSQDKMRIVKDKLCSEVEVPSKRQIRPLLLQVRVNKEIEIQPMRCLLY